MTDFWVRRGSADGEHELYYSNNGWNWLIEYWDGEELLEAAQPVDAPDEFFDPARLIDRYR